MTLKLQRLQMLRHPNLLQYRSAWMDDKRQLIVKITDPFMQESSFNVARTAKLPIRAVVRQWMFGLLNALLYLHSQKPPVLVQCFTTDSLILDSGDVKLAEYGLNTCFAHQGACAKEKEFYSEPLEEPSPTSDVYSFGLCLLDIISHEEPSSASPWLSVVSRRKLHQVLPLSLTCVHDLQIKDLIQQCLKPADKRPTTSQLLHHRFFTETDEELDPEPVKFEPLLNKLHDIPLKLPVKIDDRSTITVQFTYNLSEDSPTAIARQISDEFKLTASKSNKLAIEIKKSLAKELAKVAEQPAFDPDAIRRKWTLLEMDPIECQIPVSIRLMMPEFSAACRVDFNYILGIDSPDQVARELIRELNLHDVSKLSLEQEISKLIRTKQKINLGVQTSFEEIAELSDCSSTHAGMSSNVHTSSDNSDFNSDNGSPDFVHPKKEKCRKKTKVSNKKHRDKRVARTFRKMLIKE